MNLPDKPGSRQIERLARRTAVVAGVAALGMTCIDPRDFSIAYRFVLFAVLAPPVGCLIFTLIHRMTGGQWAAGLRPFLLAGVSFLPWIWLLALPLAFFPPSHIRQASSPAASLNGYESLPMVLVRFCIYAAIFFGLRKTVSDDAGRDSSPSQNRRPWVGPVGLIVLVFTLTSLADDWIESLDPGWHSTGFPLVWMTGQAVAGLSLAVLGGLAFGTQPASAGGAGRPLGIDWGNLLMATLLSWCYVAFAQFLIIWAGDLPAEISWFKIRTDGLWIWVPPWLAVFGFLLPFLLLLSRRAKQCAGGLAWVAVMLMLSHGLYTAWLILPVAGPLSPAGWLLVLTLLAAGWAVLVECFWAAARQPKRATA